MEDLENFVRNYLINKTLTDLELYTINPDYFAHDPNHTWIIDGGISIKIDEDEFSFGWDSKKELVNMLPAHISSLTGELEINDLDAKQADELGLLIDKKIDKVHFKWNFYQELDDNMELIEVKKYIPFEIVISFDNGSNLQLSAINFDFDGTTVSNFRYDSQKELLISVNKPLSITLENDDVN